MTGIPPAVQLLARAIDLVSRSIDNASRADPTSPTPCTEWDLGTLVRHVAHSAASIRELMEGSPPAPPPPAGCSAARSELRRLREAVASVPRCGGVDLVALTGVYELTVHAWDIDRAVGSSDELPLDLVDALLIYAPRVLHEIERTGLFADEVSPSATRTDTDRLLALFGRRRRET
ncbi:maleylpyruvate isomerase family mycothiol-dependent enzyme [Rugosimonospora africana]|uniref:TIGR03086 family protein n=1 Tax=Rugosimonospora africana TaxID=556532 RepID=A0A8J3QVF7_9ACTN|nr:maleylpyruvate isomerase family mycothiol-dependent enzyme [Rugosimonospora africana]GIH15531.1 TIGR03086 family protein [Rugosimonospora africana]